ncbi:permease-like cell division protein FtsX [Candidatus Dojkabacteria bacterium]|nr:permease-like cell division protein FtsX [Candidatus Dojkabacteria bacterium]
MKLLTRALKTTFKQIKRSGWLSWASIAVMTMAFLVTTIFLVLAFVLNLVLKSIENDPHIYVFFNAGTQETEITTLKSNWEIADNVESISYTSEEEALKEFKEINQKTNPITADSIREKVLPSSLGIRVKSIEKIDDIIKTVEQEKETNPNILRVGYSETVIESIKEIVNIVRLVGTIIIGMLVIVILLFTFLTVEFRIFNRAEEIGIMQLVGGSLMYIRLPFILESTIYGIIGAALSNIIILTSYFGILRYYSETDLIKFIYRFFGSLPWPAITNEQWIILILAIVGLGGFLGFINSSIAIRRYIK